MRSHVVCPSVCPSVTLVDCDHIGWNSSKIISRLVSLGCSLFATPTWLPTKCAFHRCIDFVDIARRFYARGLQLHYTASRWFVSNCWAFLYHLLFTRATRCNIIQYEVDTRQCVMCVNKNGLYKQFGYAIIEWLLSSVIEFSLD